MADAVYPDIYLVLANYRTLCNLSLLEFVRMDSVFLSHTSHASADIYVVADSVWAHEQINCDVCSGYVDTKVYL